MDDNADPSPTILTVVLDEPQEASALPNLSATPALAGTKIEVEASPAALAALDRSASDYVLWVERGARLDPELVEKLWSRRTDAEVVLASRYLRGGGDGLPFGISFLHRRANRLLRRALRLACYDPLSAIRLYARTALAEIPEAARSRSSPLELLVRLEALGFRIREIPYRARGEGGFFSALRKLGRNLLAIPRLRRARNAPDAADADDHAYESSLPWRRRWLAARQRIIVGYLEVDVPVLDVGCGSGRLIQTVSKAIGLDRDLRKLRFLRGRARATVAGELLRLPFRDASFPQVVCSDVAGSLDAASFLSELRRILKPHGTLVLAAPDGSRLQRWLGPRSGPGGETRRTSERDVRAALEKNGFSVDEVRRVFRREIIVRAVRRETAGAT